MEPEEKELKRPEEKVGRERCTFCFSINIQPEPGAEPELDLLPVKGASIAPVLVPKKVERSEEEKREIEADLEKLADRLSATLSAACSRKKKRR